MEKVQNKLQGWKSKILSQAAKTVFIRAVASSILSYVMSSTLVPKAITKNLDSLFRRFWWGFEDRKKKKFTPKSWNSISIPKSLGGLGIRTMSSFNSALVLKNVWSLLNGPNSLWKEVISKKYLGSKTFFEAAPKVSDSRFWKSLLKQREFLRSSACYQINNGSSTKVWTGPWIPTIHNFIPDPNPENNLDPNLNMTVSELILEEPRRWNVLLFNTLFSDHSSREIQKISLANHNFQTVQDKINWIYHSFEKFLVKLAYAALVKDNNPPNPNNQTLN
ncbi:hypothetical protein F2P56_029042 [Juglans regia]|uniref:Uncharacterized protein n=2 Tax=Juglans regia TaxID=51240 RepID=A0A833SW65_JUGRE|nr:uncharacterized mitochondrial protein AtMg00310-like [Juglans regia]KAF5448516.1 hypothetical protein F2P56_029042 [Juglans regia]